MRTTFSVPSLVGFARSYYVLRTEAGWRQWVDCWRGLVGVENETGCVSWRRPLNGRTFVSVETTELSEAMVRCLPPDHGSREANELVEMIANYTDAAHPEYRPAFHANVVTENPTFWRPIAQA